MLSPLRLWRDWYLVKDTSIPRDYPPRCKDELVRNRLALSDRFEMAVRRAGLDDWRKKATP